VVMSVISILMGILMPALASARRVAYRTLCKQNLHGCAIAFRMYLDDNANIMPWAMYLPSIPSDDELSKNLKPISVVLAKYLSGNEALKCPADKEAKYFREQGSSYQYNTGLNGMRLDQKEITFIRRRHGRERTLTLPLAEVEVMSDYSGFHGKQNSDGDWPLGAYTYLYADNLIADRERSK
jgi:type II secretory pathway pseudopilin PulG